MLVWDFGSHFFCFNAKCNFIKIYEINEPMILFLYLLSILLGCLVVNGKVLGNFGNFSEILEGLDGKFVISSSEEYMRKYLLGTGQYERPLINLIKDILTTRVSLASKVVFLDVGANFGLWTVPLATLAGSKGHIFSFEAQRYVANHLSATLLLNNIDNVRIIHAAVSNVSGHMLMNDISPTALIPGHTLNYGAFSLHYHLNPAKQPNVPTSIVRQVQLDEVFEHELEHKCPLFMKIDVEMYELEVLLGAMNLLTRCKPLILLEANCPMLNRSLFQLLWSLGYELAWTVMPIVDYDAAFDHGNADGRMAIHSFSQDTPELIFNVWFYSLVNVLAVPKDWMDMDTLLAQHPNTLRRVEKGKYSIGEYNISYCVNGIQGVDGSMSRCGVIYGSEDKQAVEQEGKQKADCETIVSEFALHYWQNFEQ
ncbi:FkbM family methyltransferase [archaeon]|nr:MAG: FkbM family methyltransferase [archaeon]